MRYDVNLFLFILNLMVIMCLVHGSMNMPIGWLNRLQELAAIVKEIGTCSSMLVKHFSSRAIVGHAYPIVSIYFHEHAMTYMMVLRYGYAFLYVSSDARKPCQVMECLR